MEIARVIESQRGFFASGKTKDIRFRIESLARLRRAILSNEAAIAEALQKDLHKSFYESFLTEIGIVLGEIDDHIRKLRRWSRRRRVFTPVTMLGSACFVQPEPLGVVLVIAPWNYPFQLVMAPLIGAISAGNCVVVKSAEYSRHTSALLIRLLSSIFDSEYVAVFDGGYRVGNALLGERFDYIFFTGSAAFGRDVARKAAENLTPVTLELGGKSPVVVTESADLSVAARRIVWGKFLNAGQTCIAPDYLLVHRSVKSLLVERMIETIREMFGDDPERTPDYGRMIRKEAFDRAVKMLSEGKVLWGGRFEESSLYVAPTLIEGMADDSVLMTEEVFAPVLPIVSYETDAEAIDFVSRNPKPLAFYLFGRNRRQIASYLNKIASGGVCVNDVVLHIANNRLPFGGVGGSGYGKYHGRYSFETFSNLRSIVSTTTLFDVPFRYSNHKLPISFLRKLM